MTAQGAPKEPPQAQSVTNVKQGPRTSKSRQKKFNRYFPSVDDEKILNHYSCALIGDILLQGHLYITKNYFAFYSNVFGYVTKILIPVLSVENITKEKTARIIPNAIGIKTSENKHVFGSLMSRDSTFRYMIKIWETAQNALLLEEGEPELLRDLPISETESSESNEAEKFAENASMLSLNESQEDEDVKFDECQIAVPESVSASKNAKSITTLLNFCKHGIYSRINLFRDNLLYCVTVIIIITLFISATVLLYRVVKLQDKYIYLIQGNFNMPKEDEMHRFMVQWQKMLHLKSTNMIASLIHYNQNQLATLRRSLETLSAILLMNDYNSSYLKNSKAEHFTNDNSN